MIEDITTPYARSDNMGNSNLESEIAQIQGKSPLRSRQQYEVALEWANNDVKKSDNGRVRNVSIGYLDFSKIAGRLERSSAQGAAGGDAHAGQKRHLELGEGESNTEHACKKIWCKS